MPGDTATSDSEATAPGRDPSPEVSTGRAPGLDRLGIVVAAAIAVLALLARIHNAFAFPALFDFDGPGHALYVFDLLEGHLPVAGSWSSFHPPLYYALGALLWPLLPEAVPVHAGLRLLSAAAGFAALGVVARCLAARVGWPDAAVVVAVLAGAPVFAIATSMLGNETLCALLVTVVLARLVAIPDDTVLRHAALTGAISGLAALTKATGIGVLPVVVLAYAVPQRRRPRRALAAVALALLCAAIAASPHYARLVARSDSPLAVMSGGISSEALGTGEMAHQRPGERHLRDYVSFPLASLLAPSKDAPGMIASVPGLLYASTWADAHGQFLPADQPGVLRGAAASALAGLLPTALAGIGGLALLRAPRRLATTWPAHLFAVLLLGAFLLQTWVVPVYSAVKASYLLPALLPAGLLLGAGLSRFEGAARLAVRGVLLAVAGLGVGVTWWGWWA